MIEEILYTSLKAKIARKTIYAKAKEWSLEINKGQYRWENQYVKTGPTMALRKT
jgi:hypothetical protein